MQSTEKTLIWTRLQMLRPALSPAHLLVAATTETCQSSSTSSKAHTHDSSSIPPQSRKSLPPTQIAPRPCTSDKNLPLHKRRTEILLTDYPPTLVFAGAAPSHSTNQSVFGCVCRGCDLPANSHLLLTRAGATGDENIFFFAQLFPLPLSTALLGQPVAGTGRCRGPSFRGSFKQSAGALQHGCAPGPPLTPPGRGGRAGGG